MNPNSTVYKVFYNRTSGKKAGGRPRKRWLDGIAESCQRAKITITQATRTAQDKNRKPQHWATTDDQQHFHTYFVLPEPNMDNEQSAGTNSNYM